MAEPDNLAVAGAKFSAAALAMKRATQILREREVIDGRVTMSPEMRDSIVAMMDAAAELFDGMGALLEG